MVKSEYSGKVSSANGNGTGDLNINISLGGKKAVGPIQLSANNYLPDNAVDARTQRNMNKGEFNLKISVFANPKQNAYKLGFKEGMKVADFGSGSGAYTLVLSDVVGTTGIVYAVDIQRDLLTRIQNEATKAKKENIEIVWGNMEASEGIGLKDELLDGVLLSNTLFQADNKIAIIKEAWRVLRPGGILAVIDWSDSFAGIGPMQNMVVTQAEATLLGTDNGFALKSNFNAGEHHYGLIFIKVMSGETNKDVLDATHKEDNDFVSRTIGQELI